VIRKSKIHTQDLRTQSIDETDFLVIDFETTGLFANGGDRACEIGAVKLRGGAVIETFSTLIDPRRPISSGAYAVNKISSQMLETAPEFSEIANQLWQMMNDAVLVAYNAPFDFSFLVSEFRLAGYPAITNVVVDALAIARQILPGLNKYPQENVARVVGIPFPVKHRALEDAMVTAKMFTLFTSILKAHDLRSVADLNRKDMIQVLNAKRLSIVTDALHTQRNLWLKYLSSSNGEISERIVTPKELAGQCSNGRTHLLAFCHSAQMERTFQIARMLDIRVIDHQSL
jgi:DNA polymerase III subunit alpha, Gram-positive type